MRHDVLRTSQSHHLSCLACQTSLRMPGPTSGLVPASAGRATIDSLCAEANVQGDVNDTPAATVSVLGATSPSKKRSRGEHFSEGMFSLSWGRQYCMFVQAAAMVWQAATLMHAHTKKLQKHNACFCTMFSLKLNTPYMLDAGLNQSDGDEAQAPAALWPKLKQWWDAEISPGKGMVDALLLVERLHAWLLNNRCAVPMSTHMV
eukprot:350500-Chlamydomonas_euryale.AAC.8